jgi:hypothetical protein
MYPYCGNIIDPTLTIAIMFNLASFRETSPPELLSLTPPVSGDLAPMEILPEFAAAVPESSPAQ